MEGKGLKSSITECNAQDAPLPKVSEKDGYVRPVAVLPKRGLEVCADGRGASAARGVGCCRVLSGEFETPNAASEVAGHRAQPAGGTADRRSVRAAAHHADSLSGAAPVGPPRTPSAEDEETSTWAKFSGRPPVASARRVLLGEPGSGKTTGARNWRGGWPAARACPKTSACPPG